MINIINCPEISHVSDWKNNDPLGVKEKELQFGQVRFGQAFGDFSLIA